MSMELRAKAAGHWCLDGKVEGHWCLDGIKVMRLERKRCLKS